jgi:hypothetical protein
VITTTDSNLWGGDSGHTYTLTRKPDGTTDVDVVVVREGKNVRGRLLGLTLTIFGKRVLGRSWARPSRPSKPGTTAVRPDHVVLLQAQGSPPGTDPGGEPHGVPASASAYAANLLT